MGVRIAASQKDRGSLESPGVIARRCRWPDQAAYQAYDAAVAPRIARREFGNQAGSLGKSQRHDTLAADTPFSQLLDERLELSQGAVEIGLVGSQWSQK